MKVFISWSGTRSKFVADSLRSWIPRVLQATKPWMSEEDISSGARWSAEIASELEETRVGIICLTPENQHNPWVMFEAGALSKTLSETFVCPYLYDLSPTQLSGPMSQFQATVSNKEGTERIMQTLNKALGDNNILSTELVEIFEVWWPKLEEKLSDVPKMDSTVVTPRPQNEIFDEILNNTREQLRREEIRLNIIQESEVRLDKLINLLEDFSSKYVRMLDGLKNFPKSLDAMTKHLSTTEGDSGKLEMVVGQLEKAGIEINMDNLSPGASQMGDMLKLMKELADKGKKDTKLLLKTSDKKEDE